MSSVTRRPAAFPTPLRRYAEPLNTLCRHVHGRAIRLGRDIALSGRLSFLLVGIVLVEQAATLLAVGFDGASPALAAHVLVPLSSASVALSLLLLLGPIDELRREAMRDPLTGASNRAGFERRLQRRVGRRTRFGGRSREVLIALDLDGFKRVNDTFGHAVGDGVLREIVARMRANAPRGSTIGRLGGDEFVLAFRLDARMSATAVTEALRASLVARPIVLSGVAHRIGVTAGVACRESGEPIDALMTRADLALIAGKLRAKNRSYAASPTARLTESPAADRQDGRRVT